MSVWSQIAGSDLWSLAVTKINNVIGSYNEFAGGTAGQRLIKASNTDFDIRYDDPEFRQTSTTSNTVGLGNKTFSIPYCTWDGSFGFKVKVTSDGTSEYMIGSLVNTSGSFGSRSWTLYVDSFEGSGTHTDWVLTPIAEPIEQSRDFVVNTTTFPNAIMGIGPVFSNGTLREFWASSVKMGSLITVTGFIRIEATNSSFNKNIIAGYLNNNIAIRDGNTGRYVSGVANVSWDKTESGVVKTYASAGYIDNYNATSTTSTILYLIFRDTPMIVSNGQIFNYNFSLTYLTDY